MVKEKVSCEEAIKVYEKLKEQFDVYPTGALLLCLAGAITETRDVDVVSKKHDKFTKIIVDDVVVHIFPWNHLIHDECYAFDNYLAIYYCLKYKLYKLSLSR